MILIPRGLQQFVSVRISSTDLSITSNVGRFVRSQNYLEIICSGMSYFKKGTYTKGRRSCQVQQHLREKIADPEAIDNHKINDKIDYDKQKKDGERLKALQLQQQYDMIPASSIPLSLSTKPPSIYSRIFPPLTTIIMYDGIRVYKNKTTMNEYLQRRILPEEWEANLEVIEKIKQEIIIVDSSVENCKTPSLTSSIRLNTYGSGDSYLIENVFPPEVADRAYKEAIAQIDFTSMSNFNSLIPRLVAVEGEVLKDEVIHEDVVYNIQKKPLYRYPTDVYTEAKHFSSITLELKSRLQAILDELHMEDSVKTNLNHALIQMYRDGHDYIGEHSDKTLDIKRGSLIVSCSLGASRTMYFKSKSVCHNSEDGASTGRLIEKIIIPHNSAFIIGPLTNRCFVHGIKQDKRASYLKRDDEVAYNCNRISFTFRDIATFIVTDNESTSDSQVYYVCGQGAKVKCCDPATRATTGRNINTDDDANSQKIQLTEVFAIENRMIDFDWNCIYGDGFDVC